MYSPFLFIDSMISTTVIFLADNVTTLSRSCVESGFVSAHDRRVQSGHIDVASTLAGLDLRSHEKCGNSPADILC